MRSSSLLSALSLAALSMACPSARAADEPKDYKDFDLARYGITPVKETKDSRTGFVVGGKNSTKLIRGLTEINGLTIAKLEKAMRPGQSSTAGFLGKEEKLLDVLEADNKYVVDEMGLTHQELARHMHAMGVISEYLLGTKKQRAEFTYHGRPYKVTREDTNGVQWSPFEDRTGHGSNVEVTNTKNGKKIWYGLLVPFMVERYGFYEGKGTKYRVEPRQVIAVFDFLEDKGKKK